MPKAKPRRRWAKLHFARASKRSSASTNSPQPLAPHPPATATASITSLPPELARRIVILLHPADLAALIRTSRSMRQLFRPGDTELQFAVEHLLARFPRLRAFVKRGKRSQELEAEYLSHGFDFVDDEPITSGDDDWSGYDDYDDYDHYDWLSPFNYSDYFENDVEAEPEYEDGDDYFESDDHAEPELEFGDYFDYDIAYPELDDYFQYDDNVQAQSDDGYPFEDDFADDYPSEYEDFDYGYDDFDDGYPFEYDDFDDESFDGNPFEDNALGYPSDYDDFDDGYPAESFDDNHFEYDDFDDDAQPEFDDFDDGMFIDLDDGEDPAPFLPEEIRIYDEMMEHIAVFRELKEVPLRQLPLCYALAVLKLGNFGSTSFDAVSGGVFSGAIPTNAEPVDERTMIWLKRLLLQLLGMRKLELGFEMRLIKWKGKVFERKEASDNVRNLALFLDSVQAARLIAEIEKNSVRALQSVRLERKNGPDAERYTLSEMNGDPEDFSASIRRFAFFACSFGAASVLRFLLETYPAVFTNMAEHQSEVFGESYVCKAFFEGHGNVLRVLAEFMKLQPYCNDPFAADFAQKFNLELSLFSFGTRVTYLQEATQCGDESMVRVLLEIGADPNFRLQDVSSACSQDDPNGVDGRGPSDEPTALHIACRKPHRQLIPLLVAHGADPLLRTAEGYTALMHCRSAHAATVLLGAIERHAPHTMMDLLAAQCNNGFNALQKAFKDNSEGLLIVLLKAIPKWGGFEDRWALLASMIPVLIALVPSQFAPLYPRLSKACAPAMREILMSRDDKGRTFLHTAAALGRRVTLRNMLYLMLAIDDDLCETLLRTKAGKERLTPLHLAALSGSLECVRMLLKHGADPGIRDANRRTPLTIAWHQKHLSMVRVLLKVTPKEVPVGRQLALPKPRRKGGE
ncbi:Ankyrin repeat domain-containing protein 16 [Phlyctochytrium bullatum]|nr:Ankyrin repeat domain-containing protein 16 [Phlyctochytrium bullatum]